MWKKSKLHHCCFVVPPLRETATPPTTEWSWEHEHDRAEHDDWAQRRWLGQIRSRFTAWFELGRGETTWTRDLVVEHSVGEDLEHDWLTTWAELGCSGVDRRRRLTQQVGCDRGNMAETWAWEGADADHRRGLSFTADSWQRALGRTVGRRHGWSQTAVKKKVTAACDRGKSATAIGDWNSGCI